MARFEKMMALLHRLVYRASILGLTGYFWLLASPVAWAAKRKAAAVEAPTKSYVMPYMIVIMVIAMGLMTVCRPSKRLDKPDDMHRKDDEKEN